MNSDLRHNPVRGWVRWLRLAAAAWGCVAVTAWAQTQSTADYDYYLTGAANAQGTAVDAVVPKPATNAVALMGGATDVQDAFEWMVNKAGGGNFLVLRASGADGYNDWIYKTIGGVASVESIVIKTRKGASSKFVLDRIAKADAIFLAGGDQWDYVRLWKGTPLVRAINDALAQRHVPIGGTSAGLMVLTQYVFTAQNLTGNLALTSDIALANPYDPLVTMDRDILAVPGLGHTVGDAHIYTRDRMGRLVTFMARNIMDQWVTPEAARAIGVEAKTALLMDNGQGRLVGAGAVYFLNPLAGSVPRQCDPPRNLSLDFRNLQVYRMTDKTDSFDLSRWLPMPGAIAAYQLDAVCGVLTSTQNGGKIY